MINQHFAQLSRAANGFLGLLGVALLQCMGMLRASCACGQACPEDMSEDTALPSDCSMSSACFS